MVLTFQGWRFQRWRQASLWTVKKIRRQRIRGITRRRSESNARGACRIIGDNSTSRTIESHGNDSKTRKLGALWTETERRWKAIFHLRTADSKTTEKRFFGLWLEIRSGYSTTTPRRKNTTLSQSLSSISTSTPRPNIHSSKIMLCIWWNQKGLVYYELLKSGVSITGDRYRLQLIRLSRALREIGRNTSKDMIKLFFFMTTLGLMSLKS